jgi:hypothetical protein
VNINVTVDEVSLASVTDGSRYGEDDSRRPETLADLVADRLVQRLVTDRDSWGGFSATVLKIRDDEIRKAVAPLIAEALARPVVRTNTYGEAVPGAAATTLAEIIADEARKAFTAKASNDYRSDGRSVVRVLVAEEVKRQFAGAIAEEVAKARELVAGEIGSTVAAAVAEGMRKR